MTFQATMQAVRRLNDQAEALAALGGAMAARQSARGDTAALDPGLTSKLERVVAALGADVGDGLDDRQIEMLRGSIRSLLRQALDLVENPSRKAASISDDPVVLQAQGQADRAVVPILSALIAEDAALADRLGQPARFLNVGCGVGRVALDMAERWPRLAVDAIDTFAPALALAEINRASAPSGDRVAFHRAALSELEADGTFALVFAPVAHVDRETFGDVCSDLLKALAPGGWGSFACSTVAEDPLAQALSELRIARGGGCNWSAQEVSSALSEAGFDRIASRASEDGAMTVVAARKPG